MGKIVSKSIDDLFQCSDQVKKVGYTEEEELEIMELILRMKEKGTFLKKSVEMMAYRTGRTVVSIRAKITNMLKHDPETRAAIFPLPSCTANNSSYYMHKKLNKIVGK